MPQLGSTFGVYLNVQFGGDRQKRTPPAPPKPPRLPVVPVKEEPKKEERQPLVPHNPAVTPQQVKPNQAPIAVKTETMEGVPAGHYVVIGVYANPRNAYSFLQQMGKRYEVSSFVNKKNGLTYIYLGKGALSLEDAQNLMRKYMLNLDFIAGIWVLEAK